MKTNAGIRPRAGQFWVCRDGRTFEPDFLAPTDLQGFTATQVAYGATDGSLTGSSSLTWNGSTFAVGGGVSATSLTDSGLTSGRVTFASTAGLLADSANLTYGSGKLTVADGTASTSTSTGAVVISNSGGVGVSGAAWIGGLANIAGAVTAQSTLAVTGTSTYTGAAGFGGGAVSSFSPIAVQGFSGIVGTTAIGLFVNAAAPSTATSAVRGAQFSLTGAASTTHAEATGFLCAGIAPGAGGTLTRVQGAWLNPQSASGTNTCGLLISGGLTYTGAWAIRSEATEASYLAGALTVDSTTDSTSITTGAHIVSGGIGVAKRLTLDGGTGKTLRIVNSVANASVAVTLGSTGPTGSTAGAPQGWMRIDINGTDRYMPFW